MKRATFCLAVILATGAMVASAATPNIVLGPDGTLYRLQAGSNSLSLTMERADKNPQIVPVPQTSGIDAPYLLLDFDPATKTVVAAWQENPTENLSRIMLATYHEGTWFGPVAVAGQSRLDAVHPSLLVHDTKLTETDDDGNVSVVGIESRIHLAWWEGLGTDDGGSAYYASAVLDENGVPDMEDWVPVEMETLVPWGSGCSLEEDASGLTFPRLFTDAQSGDPHLIFADLPNCMFGIVRLAEEPAGSGDGDPLVSQRRRNVIVFGLRKMVFIKPGLPLDNANFEVGHDLSIALYWNTKDAVQYITLDNDSWSDIKSLKVGE
ncbi:MAG TPA: hypothetical protein ENK19_11480, partial [Acidobacteria bacterium]|nr:hypothetical protein [Acidobacteriota bacterium]